MGIAINYEPHTAKSEDSLSFDTDTRFAYNCRSANGFVEWVWNTCQPLAEHPLSKGRLGEKKCGPNGDGGGVSLGQGRA